MLLLLVLVGILSYNREGRALLVVMEVFIFIDQLELEVIIYS